MRFAPGSELFFWSSEKGGNGMYSDRARLKFRDTRGTNGMTWSI